MGCAAVISFEEVRASQQWDALRQELHTRFDQWLDGLETPLQGPAPTLAQVTEPVWHRRQALTGGLTATIVQYPHHGESTRQQTHCPACDRLLPARAPVARTVETMVGAVQLTRPYFSCRACRHGVYPLDEVVGLAPGRLQLDGQQAVATLVTEVPDDEAQTLFGALTGVHGGSERMHTGTNHVAEGLTVLEVAPSRDEIMRRSTAVAAGHRRRPVGVRGLDGAFGPPRPDSARERRPGRRGKRAKRAGWCGQWRDATGFRFDRLDRDRIVHLLRWHQVHNAEQRGEALKHVKEVGVIPEEQVRLCVVCAGAEWIWKHVQALFPHARQVLDSYHCAQYLHKGAKAHYGASVQALEWVEATMPRLSLGKVGLVLGGLHRMQAQSDDAEKAIAHCWAYLDEHRGRTAYRTLRRGGYPLGSGGIASSNKCICHVRLQRSGAWWYEANSNHM